MDTLLTNFVKSLLLLVVNISSLFFFSYLLSHWMQVARNLGKTLRTFQPTIRELQVGAKYFRLNCYADATFLMLWLYWMPFSPFRMFQGNLKVHLNERLVSMTFQVPHRTHTIPISKTPHQLHHPLIVQRVLRLLLTLVSNLLSIFWLAKQFIKSGLVLYSYTMNDWFFVSPFLHAFSFSVHMFL